MRARIIRISLAVSLLRRPRSHRDLHSFPTRRSSDLERRRHAHDLERSGVEHLQARGAVEFDRLDVAVGPDGDGKAQVAVQDRKSTRLNSSHITISYAVFCLKKKIKHSKDRSAIYKAS